MSPTGEGYQIGQAQWWGPHSQLTVFETSGKMSGISVESLAHDDPSLQQYLSTILVESLGE